MADCLGEEYRKSHGLFHRPQHGVSLHAPRPRLASAVGSRPATGPRRRARPGRVAGDGQPALLGLLGKIVNTGFQSQSKRNSIGWLFSKIRNEIALT